MSVIKGFCEKRKVQLNKELADQRELALSRLRFDEACKKFAKRSKELKNEIEKK